MSISAIVNIEINRNIIKKEEDLSIRERFLLLMGPFNHGFTVLIRYDMLKTFGYAYGSFGYINEICKYARETFGYAYETFGYAYETNGYAYETFGYAYILWVLKTFFKNFYGTIGYAYEIFGYLDEKMPLEDPSCLYREYT